MGELAIFYCHHQAERMTKVLQAWNRPDGPIIRKAALPCSGKLEVSFLLKALEKGAEGVALFGCPEGECRYLVGSTRAKNRVEYARRILREIGLPEERVRRFVLEDHLPPEAMEAVSEWVKSIQALAALYGN